MTVEPSRLSDLNSTPGGNEIASNDRLSDDLNRNKTPIFRRTEQCIIPYATQEGEISFCTYNTGVGWRNIIEKMHMTATLTKWYEEHGRHEIFAGGKKVGMSHVGHDLALNMEHVNSEANHTLDNLGIAKNAREEKIRARAVTAADKVKADAENARMAKLYREQVLGEKPVEGLVSLDSHRPRQASNPAECRAGCGRLSIPNRCSTTKGGRSVLYGTASVG